MKTHRFGPAHWLAAAFLFVAILAVPAAAQDPNACDEPGEAPDVIVGDLHQLGNYGNAGDIYAYSVGTTSCNIGTCWLNWFSGTEDHPVIGQNMFRIKDDRITQIGQSWLKHGFFALSESLCSGGGCVGTNGTHLGVNCSDPYSAGLNGQQSNLGPKFEVNAATGEFPFPYSYQGTTGDTIYKRLQVHRDDLDPAMNAGATYFVEGHYITKDDAAAGNDNNNASYRQVEVDPTTFEIDFITGEDTVRTKAGVQAWADHVPGVKEALIDVPNDGRFILASRPVVNGDGTTHFEYALQNLSSDRSGQAFWVPVPAGATVTDIGFHDVDYHSGELWDSTDWIGYHDQVNNRVIWFTETYANNPNANALRWSTMYTFWFDVDAPPALGGLFVDLFKPGDAGDPDTVQGFSFAPSACNNDGYCQSPGETCSNCPGDCVTTGPSIGTCGDGVCEPGIGEDCVSCAGDCAGEQSGNPSNRYCCGDGDGDGPVGCGDSRCNSGGFVCGATGEQFCCGDGVCDVSEDSCQCSADCGPAPVKEFTCGDGFDNDCDGNADCNDLDCCMDGGCATGVDNDNDGVAECDCDDGNPDAWGTPSAARDLTLEESLPAGTTLSWLQPLEVGGSTLDYETLRSANPGDWLFASVCLMDAMPSDTMSLDAQAPLSGEVFHYLIRATNGCPDGEGSLGRTSADEERSGATCP